MADLSAIFDGVNDRFDPQKAAGLNLGIVFDLSGDGGGKWNVQIRDGELTSGQGAIDSPSATISMDADDFAKMSSGDLNPMMAFMSGKIKVDGDLSAVMKFQSAVGF